MDQVDSRDLTSRFYAFFDEFKKNDIRQAFHEDRGYLELCFYEISEYDIELGDQILTNPTETMRIMEDTVKLFAEEAGESKDLNIRLVSLPETERVMIRDIRSQHLSKFVLVEGLIRRKTDVRPQLIRIDYLCTNPSCSYSEERIKIQQDDIKVKTLKACPKCRSQVEEAEKVLVDSQSVVVEEIPEQLENSADQPKRINIVLQEDQVRPFKDSRTNPGSRVYIIGQVKELPMKTRTGSDSVNYDLVIEGNFMALSEEDYTEIDISDEEQEKIREIASRENMIETMVENMAPSIYGHNKIKEAILLQLFGGVKAKKGEGVNVRGDIHILIVGDPGAAKSQLLKSASSVAPKSMFVSGKSATGAGLTATVMKDDLTRGWALEAGAMVLASGGLCCTTGDTQFLKENYEKCRFDELFEEGEEECIKHPEFRVLSMNNETQKLEPYNIKQVFKKKNDKKIYKVLTRTGREIKLTEDNEVFTVQDSSMYWEEIRNLSEGDYIAVPKNYSLEGKDSYSGDFAYIAGITASDGHLKLDSRRGHLSIYNTNKKLINAVKIKFENLNLSYNIYEDKRERKGGIVKRNGRKILGKKTIYNLYNSRKELVSNLISFGIPEGNKSSEEKLDDSILTYSTSTIADFMRGVFDGDGSVRKNPYEISLVSGMYENAKLFQQLLLRLGIISYIVEVNNESWHCVVRGGEECKKFYDIVGSEHPDKENLLKKISTKKVKNRIDILPNYQRFFKELISNNYNSLGQHKYKYFWNYKKASVAPSISKLDKLNSDLNDETLNKITDSDVLWDKIISMEELWEDYVYDFTMEETNNFVANDVIMHNCIDELDKMSDEDTSAMHEALEQQSISIAKANIRATLNSETTVLGAANPKMGRFDPYGDIAKQINFPPALLSRFDLIFVLRDNPDKKKDDMIASHILQSHKDKSVTDTEIDMDLMKKYIAYAKENIQPVLTQAAIDKIKEFYVSMRNASGDEESNSGMPITARQLEAIVRLSEAYARMKLDREVKEEYAQRAIDLLLYCLEKIGVDPKTGQLDIDRLTTGITATTRNQYKIVQQIIDKLEMENPQIKLEDIMSEAEQQNLDRKEVENILEKLKQEGIIFEPRKNIYKKLS